MKTNTIKIALIGGGPAAMFMYKRLVESGLQNLEVAIFEASSRLGAGMPYSNKGATDVHITNVSGNEIPDIVEPVAEWIDKIPKQKLERFNITKSHYSDYHVLPRLLFGDYLEAQFNLLLKEGKEKGIITTVHFNCAVADVKDNPKNNTVDVITVGGERHTYSHVVICTGHNWPHKNEDKIPGYFDSPYPPSKIELKTNHAVALRGSSLTAVDAIRTLARSNGAFAQSSSGKLAYIAAKGSEDFKIVIHTRNGLLPAVRFHLEDTHLQNDSLLTEEEIQKHREENNGFLSLDFIFEKDFKDVIRKKDPDFYTKISGMNMEEFVAEMIAIRENLDPFVLLKAEYAEAEKSIKRHESVYWKEMLAVLSFAMNYPAKYFSAEDMMRLKGTLMPLISVVIAFLPQTSCKELLALHDAGRLEMVAVGNDSSIEPLPEGGICYRYKDEAGQKVEKRFHTFVDCIGQPQLEFEDFPFKSLAEDKTVSPAKLKFRDEGKAKALLDEGNNKIVEENNTYYLRVPGLGINDNFQVLDEYGAYNERVYIMAVPYIGGYNPDYSGLDFAEAASEKVLESLNAVTV